MNLGLLFILSKIILKVGMPSSRAGSYFFSSAKKSKQKMPPLLKKITINQFIPLKENNSLSLKQIFFLNAT
jgi:hypothetical protein